MKKVLIGIMAAFLIGQAAYSQPVYDNAVIPMAITVNSILRLTVVDGGNIEFVFNTLNDVTNGLAGPRYVTRLTVASSSNWSLNLAAASANFTNDAGGNLLVNHVCFNLTSTGTNVVNNVAAGASIYNANGATSPVNTYEVLSNTPGHEIIIPGTAGNSGTPAANDFQFNWECGVIAHCGAASAMTGTPSGRYATSVVISLTAL